MLTPCDTNVIGTPRKHYGPGDVLDRGAAVSNYPPSGIAAHNINVLPFLVSNFGSTDAVPGQNAAC